jgi:hypothetical protein
LGWKGSGAREQSCNHQQRVTIHGDLLFLFDVRTS